jgi:threonine aldolase
VERPQTNILYVEIPAADVAGLDLHLRGLGIRTTLRHKARLVTHLDVDRAAIERTANAFKSFYRP